MLQTNNLQDRKDRKSFKFMSESFPHKINVDMSKNAGSKFCQDPLFGINNFEI